MAQALMTSPSTALNGLQVPARAAISFLIPPLPFIVCDSPDIKIEVAHLILR